MQRKEFLKQLALLGATPLIASSLLSACTEDDDEILEDGEDTGSDSGEDVSGDPSCEVTNSETEGPFPIHDSSSLVRSNIVGDRTGIDLSIDITVEDVNNDCEPLEGAYADIWHCDKDGNYSEYGGTQMQEEDYTDNHFLRGRQVTDSEGKVAFTSIFPGWYQGRATHIHVHIYDGDGNSLLVTQIAFPEGDDSAVVQVNDASDYGYTKGMNGYTYNENDNVFSDGTENEMSTITGSVEEGFELTHTIKVSA